MDLYSIVVLAAVVISWTRAPEHHPAVRFIRKITEPVFQAVRKVLPPMGGIDFSPMVVLIGLQLLSRLLY